MLTTAVHGRACSCPAMDAGCGKPYTKVDRLCNKKKPTPYILWSQETNSKPKSWPHVYKHQALNPEPLSPTITNQHLETLNTQVSHTRNLKPHNPETLKPNL